MLKVVYFEGISMYINFEKKFDCIVQYHEAICFAYMEATVVGGSVAEGITQRCYSSITEDYIYK
jgi:hypothetical protein